MNGCHNKITFCDAFLNSCKYFISWRQCSFVSQTGNEMPRWIMQQCGPVTLSVCTSGTSTQFNMDKILTERKIIFPFVLRNWCHSEMFKPQLIDLIVKYWYNKRTSKDCLSKLHGKNFKIVLKRYTSTETDTLWRFWSESY